MAAALEGGEWSAALPGRTLPPGKTRYPPHRDSIPDRPTRSQSLYRLSYLAHNIYIYIYVCVCVCVCVSVFV